jgi:hypothetical protein
MPGRTPAQRYLVQPILFGSKLRHTFIPTGSTKPRTEPLTSPTASPTWEAACSAPSRTGSARRARSARLTIRTAPSSSTPTTGRVFRQRNVKGHCDGLTADPALHLVITTVNEDANSSIFRITPGAPGSVRVVHYRYNDNPLPHSGSTDASRSNTASC